MISVEPFVMVVVQTDNLFKSFLETDAWQSETTGINLAETTLTNGRERTVV
jgi:hypothetical protein